MHSACNTEGNVLTPARFIGIYPIRRAIPAPGIYTYIRCNKLMQVLTVQAITSLWIISFSVLHRVMRFFCYYTRKPYEMKSLLAMFGLFIQTGMTIFGWHFGRIWQTQSGSDGQELNVLNATLTLRQISKSAHCAQTFHPSDYLQADASASPVSTHKLLCEWDTAVRLWHDDVGVLWGTGPKRFFCKERKCNSETRKRTTNHCSNQAALILLLSFSAGLWSPLEILYISPLM